ncbi:MAG: hypothetical protein K2O45_08105 [Oscillospiraceae bacterium]|nr:hypothetical protein [Oscillospiraceae bacterium]
MSKDKKAYTLDPFQEWSHRFGRICMILFFLYMLAIPLIMGAVYHAFPSASLLLTACSGVCVLFIPVGIAETISYTPILGSSTYLGFLTGNIMNLKMPCAKNAMNLAEVDQGTPEGDAVAAMAISASSMLTVIIIALGVLLIVPLQPILTIPAVQTATNYVVPALFGTFLLGFFSKERGEYQIHGKLKGAAIPFILGCVLTIMNIMVSSLQGVFILLLLPVTILCNWLMFKKKWVTVEKNPDYVPMFQKNAK